MDSELCFLFLALGSSEGLYLCASLSLCGAVVIMGTSICNPLQDIQNKGVKEMGSNHIYMETSTVFTDIWEDTVSL